MILRSLFACLLWLPASLLAATGQHALTLYGDPPAYAEDFTHFSYVNPQAPKGGTLRLSGFGSFDSLNGFNSRGTPADQLSLIYDSLTFHALDEPFSEYGLLAERIERSRALARHPCIEVTGFEASHNVRYSADTIALARARNPGVFFVWVMGADNLVQFHRWQRWREIAETVPISVLDRPGASMAAMNSVMAQTYERFRVDESDAAALARMPAPAWTFVHGPRSSQSSTRLRGEG